MKCVCRSNAKSINTLNYCRMLVLCATWNRACPGTGTAAAGLAPLCSHWDTTVRSECVGEQENSLHGLPRRREISIPTTRQLCDDKRRYGLRSAGIYTSLSRRHRRRSDYSLYKTGRRRESVAETESRTAIIL